jgi:hypothetical protein
MTTTETMIQHLDKALKDRSPRRCISTHKNALFYLDDDDNEGCTVQLAKVLDERTYFEVNNSTEKPIAVFKIDKCLMGAGTKIKRCDCALFDDTVFCFLELKYNALSATTLRIKANRTEAVDQLRSTIHFFNNTLKDNYLGRKIEAYVCTPEYYPKRDTSLDDAKIEFLEDFGIDLFEQNQRTF